MSVRRRTPFAQIPQWIIQADISSHAVRLWAALDRFAGLPHGAIPSRRTLAEEWLHTSLDTVDRAKAELIEIGALTVEDRPGHTSEYILEDRPTLGTDAEGTLGTGAQRKRARPERASLSSGNGVSLRKSAGAERSALWDALVEATGITPEAHGERTRFGMSVKELLDLGATPEEVSRRAVAFTERYPGATLTDRAIVNRWGELNGEAVRGEVRRFGRGVTSKQISEIAGRRAK